MYTIYCTLIITVSNVYTFLYIIYMHKQDFVLNDTQGLICHKTTAHKFDIFDSAVEQDRENLIKKKKKICNHLWPSFYIAITLFESSVSGSQDSRH